MSFTPCAARLAAPADHGSEGVLPRKSQLFVLIVSDAGLRSALTARLSLAGEDVVTATGFGDPLLDRAPPRGAYLVLEDRVLAEHPSWLEVLGDRERWRHVIVLADEAYGDPDPQAPVIHLSKREAGPAILKLVANWR